MITIDPPSSSLALGDPANNLNKSALTRFLNRARSAVGLAGSVEVLLTSDATLKRLNKSYRAQNKATDILSFPAAPEMLAAGLAGDLAISLDTATRQATQYGHTLNDELRILLLHGVLHLAGEDHETDSGEMAAREAELRSVLKLPSSLIDRVTQPAKTTAKKTGKKIGRAHMSPFYLLGMAALLLLLALAAYIDRIYSEMGKFLAREYQDNIDAWESLVEPRLHLGSESVALSASVLRQLSLAAVSLLVGAHLYAQSDPPHLNEFLRAGFELILLILFFGRLVPQILFTRTEGVWIVRIRFLIQAMFYLLLPITMLLSLMLSIAALAEPEDTSEEDHPSEAMDALLEAGEEEGILEESDRELVRSVVEFGDKVVREVMTPRPEIFAVPGTLTLKEFLEEIQQHVYSRVPVYRASLDDITGIAFAHDLLQVADTEAATRTVAQMQRPAEFVPETKMVAELLREMQREKQHMRIVIDEYGQVAGIVTIEDLLEAIVGSIADEHDEPEEDDSPIREPNGAYVVSGTFEISRLRELFADQFPSQPPEATESDSASDEEAPDAIRIPEHYESTTLGGLVSEIAGHIPLPGEVVEDEGLRLEVLASTDRRIDRIRVSLATPESD